MSENDFLEAVERGRQAAIDAEANLKEIRSVVRDLDALIRRLSSGSVGVIESSWPPIPRNFVPTPKGMSPPPPGRRYNALAFERGDKDLQVLCEFEPDPAGYPVKVRYEGGFVMASSRPDLVAALKDVLATPQAGRVLNALLDPEPVKQAG